MPYAAIRGHDSGSRAGVRSRGGGCIGPGIRLRGCLSAFSATVGLTKNIWNPRGTVRRSHYGVHALALSVILIIE